MKELKILLPSLALILSSCHSDESNTNSRSISSQDKTPLICTFDLRENSDNLISKPNAAIINWHWRTGQTIKIKFLDGDIALHETVKRIAIEWTGYANLKFEYVGINEKADIRIGFNLTGKNNRYGAWSELGARTEYMPQDEQTMRLGPLTGPEDSIRRTILHEFGHALGLFHETTNPAANIQWDLPKTYKYYSLQFTKDEVDRFIINKENTEEYSEYDPLSIMHYYIPSFITTNGVAVYEQSTLSKIDNESMLKWYPFPVRSVIETAERIDLVAYRKCIKSPNGRYSLEFDSGCLFILDSTNNQKTWSVGAPIYKNAMCFFQGSGEIVIIGSLPGGTFLQEIVWKSKVSKINNAQLHLQNNGDLELIQNGVVKWSSKNGKV